VAELRTRRRCVTRAELIILNGFYYNEKMEVVGAEA
jgi:hypothetical protein